MTARALIAATLLLLAAAGRAPAERVVADVSQNRIAITAGFDGSELFVYGAVARIAPPLEGRMGVVVRIAGPSTPVLVRRKSRVLGVWANTSSELVDAAPSYYAVAATGPIDETISHTENLRHRVSLRHALRLVDAASTGDEREAFLDAVTRLRESSGLYVIAPGGVAVTGDVLFRASFQLPANIVEGAYRVTVLLTRDRRVIDVFETEIDVAKAGIERLLYDASRQQPLVYGIIAIAIAMAAGLAASETFRWLRR
ncbi:TIGR02186 family protein [Rubrimonas cliftonensis]|uniref:Transmembrane protein (Alph_Pro_TM) n=1 Tax=Rubrimonas cliftonensis TaxID=89524 RepID=A0A1H4E5Q4_9RHOB|nr:TIGR02186 family protein [Rubrimonas cliftonensis]SEA80167.1 conserved hypothetical protein [Rubrimonas cliftonensis]